MRRSRRGYSLIETLVVIVLTATTLTVVTVTMHTLRRSEQRLRDDLRSQQALEQLAFRLRQDAHRAISAAVDEPDATRSRRVTLVTPDEQSIEYSSTKTGIERIVRRGETVAHRDRFLLAAAQSFWTIDKQRERPLVEFHWDQRVASQSAPGQPEAAAVQFPPAIRTVVGVAQNLRHTK